MPASLRQMASPRPPMPPVTSAMRCFISFLLLRFLDPLLHVAARRGLDRLVLRVSRPLASGDLPAAVLRDPLRPERPPAARMLGRALEPLVRIRSHAGLFRCGTCPANPIAAPVLRRRVDGAGDVARGAEHELGGAAE